MTALHLVTPRAPQPERRRRPAAPGSLLPQRLDTPLRALERCTRYDDDPTTALREAVEGIWQIVEQAASESALDISLHGAPALLARRELVQRGTCALSAVIRRGVESGALRPRCAEWAIERLPFAIVAGACAHWVLGLSPGPSLRAGTAVEAALEILKHGTRRPHGSARHERSEP